MQTKFQSRIFGAAKVTLAGAALSGFLLFTGAPSLRADDDCQKRISRADHRLHEAIEHHGRESRQADDARRQLHEAREDCYTRNRRWWDEDGHRWHSDRDWDDRDHDKYDRERERPPQ
jgi:hypothetical protein